MLKHLISYQIFFTLIFGVESPKSSLLTTEYGFIDYKNRIILARGTSSILERRSKSGDLEIIEKNLKISKGEARALARENLLDLVKLVNFDSRTVGELMRGDYLTENRIRSLVESAYQQGEIEYLEKNKIADFIGFNISDYKEILYNQGKIKPSFICKRGKVYNN